MQHVLPGGERRPWHIVQATITYVVMALALWCVFVYVPTEKVQGIVQRIFYFHVSSALTMFLAFFVVFVASSAYLWKQTSWWDSVAVSAAEIGVVFCTIVLMTGPIWGRPIWGVWWTWDPTLTLTLVLWLIYIAYLMLRAQTPDAKRTRFAAVLGIIGFVDVPLIRWSVVQWRTLHPKPVVVQEGGTTGLPPPMLLTFVIALVACVLLYFFLLRERVALAQSRHALEALRDDIEQRLES
ncbi:MAG: cytochrome c biogenesis protein CcsA [Candidatus Tectomicrobia bacterium]